jgi:hypothetical protein
MKRFASVLSGFCFLGFVGCNVNVPFDPSDLVRPIDDVFEGVQEGLADAVADPLGAKPFPVLVGGDNERVFYATSLTDIRINFPGATNDVVIPGFLGPSNLYRFERKERELIRPLIPGGAVGRLATDGRYVAYVAYPELNPPREQLRVTDLETFADYAVFDGASDDASTVLTVGMALSSGRLAFLLAELDGGAGRLRIEDLKEIDPTTEIEIRGDVSGDPPPFDLRGNRLALVERADDGSLFLSLRDLSTDTSTVIAERLRMSFRVEARVVLTDNSLVWSEPADDGLSRILRHDLTSGVTRVWVEAARGELAGATDEFLVTEEPIYRRPDRADQISVHRYDLGGERRTLATFRADGLAGQTRVIGNRAVWVNAERKIVIAPLNGGDRTIFRPF